MRSPERNILRGLTSLWIGGIVINLLLIVGVVWIVFHFVAKFW